MSNADAAFASPFGMQRRVLEQAHRATRQSVDVQRRFVRAFADTLDAQHDAQHDTVQLAETALEAWFVGARTSMPPDDIDVSEFEIARLDVLSDIEELQEEWFSAFSKSVTDGVELYDQAARGYLDALDTSFEAALDANDRAAEAATRFAEAGERAIDIEVESQ